MSDQNQKTNLIMWPFVLALPGPALLRLGPAWVGAVAPPRLRSVRLGSAGLALGAGLSQRHMAQKQFVFVG